MAKLVCVQYRQDMPTEDFKRASGRLIMAFPESLQNITTLTSQVQARIVHIYVKPGKDLTEEQSKFLLQGKVQGTFDFQVNYISSKT